MAKARKTPKSQNEETERIVLKRLEDATVEIAITGLTPIIAHKWSEKARRQLPGHPGKRSAEVQQKKGPKEPKVEAEACLHKLNGSPAMPATAFKAAIVGACRLFSEPTMVDAKPLLLVEGEGPDQLVKINGQKELREDTPRNRSGTPDLRYRYYIINWTAVLRIRFVPSRITEESVVALVDAAGRGGVGDWRPSSPKSFTGTYGTWRVDETKEVKRVR